MTCPWMTTCSEALDCHCYDARVAGETVTDGDGARSLAELAAIEGAVPRSGRPGDVLAKRADSAPSSVRFEACRCRRT